LLKEWTFRRGEPVKKTAVLAVLALAGVAAAPDSNFRWMKFDEALARAGMNGQPIAVFVAVDVNGSS
jgi:hypothetical protein